MHIPSGCSKIENSIIIDKIKGLIFGKEIIIKKIKKK
jgi:hypothetical protein